LRDPQSLCPFFPARSIVSLGTIPCENQWQMQKIIGRRTGVDAWENPASCIRHRRFVIGEASQITPSSKLVRESY